VSSLTSTPSLLPGPHSSQNPIGNYLDLIKEPLLQGEPQMMRSTVRLLVGTCITPLWQSTIASAPEGGSAESPTTRFCAARPAWDPGFPRQSTAVRPSPAPSFAYTRDSARDLTGWDYLRRHLLGNPHVRHRLALSRRHPIENWEVETGVPVRYLGWVRQQTAPGSASRAFPVSIQETCQW